MLRQISWRTLLCSLAALFACVPFSDSADTVQWDLAIPASRPWTDTGIDLESGTPLHIEASGRATVVGWSLRERLFGTTVNRRVGPEGTYLWRRRYTARGPFPLPAMADGPFPVFGLIGKIGSDGPPFYLGARYDGFADRAGRLWIGLNDDHADDNRGRFRVSVRLEAMPVLRTPEPPLMTAEARGGAPVPGARVLLLYVDGLRPDVLHEMAAGGFLPNFSRAFLEQGLDVTQAFTVFPSNTLVANGSLFTGLFPDGTGIKSQNQFERSSLKPRGQLSAWLPDGFMPMPKTRVLNLLDKYAPENTHAFLVKRRIPTLATRLGKAYQFTTLPIAPLNPPPYWFHAAVNTIGPFNVSTRLPSRLDAVNAQYAVDQLIGNPDTRVITVWLPMVDKTCHHSARGQFGAARRDLALADLWLGRLLQRLREVGWERSTYLILLSDHGHVGGWPSVNRTCNLPRDWAHRQLGCNAKVIGQEWWHPGIDERRFLFFDNQGAGQAAVFLPYGAYFTGEWRRNRLYELTHYALRPGQPTVDLLESLTAFRPPGDERGGSRPVDLILVKLDDQRIFVYRDPERQAIIHRTQDSSGRDVYRYEPVQRLTQSSDGALHAEPASAGLDPLGYLQDPQFLQAVGTPTWVTAAHTAREWLEATAKTRYPDAVVAMAKGLAWRSAVADLADLRDPDVLVTASEGWSFRSDDGAGTDHGAPLAEAMRMTLFIAGPNIPHGRLERPQRIIDILPTTLEMVGWPYESSELDGEAIGGIYE